MAHVLIPTPSQDFDPTEVAISWRVLVDGGHTVTFATPDGRPSEGDEIMLTGRGLDPWSRIAGIGRLTVLGRLLGANQDARRAYQAMTQTRAFRYPIQWSEAQADAFDGLLFPGGHRRRGMAAYLESETLQALALTAFRRSMPVAAICHGVLVLARTLDPATGRSVLFGRKTTALTWKLERAAAQIGRIGRFWDRDYYRTYLDPPGTPDGHMSVESEVRRALAHEDDFLDAPVSGPDASRRTGGVWRDTLEDPRPAFVVEDGLYVSARWPGDAHTFARAFADLLTRRVIASGAPLRDLTRSEAASAPAIDQAALPAA